MAPKKDNSVVNPAMLNGMDPVVVNYVDAKGKPATRLVDYVPKPGSGYEILTDDVLNSGNLDVLYDFRDTHLNELNSPRYAPAKRYIDARIKTAEKIRTLERKRKMAAFEGKVPPKPEVDTVKGFIGLSTIKYPDYQTSANGCWSLSYSMLLKSRGVDLSQEEIREWRPDYPVDTKKEDKANFERKRLMNTDRGNAIYPNADLAGKVLPNTAVNMLRFEPFETEQLGTTQLTKAQKKAVSAEYIEQVKSNLQRTITEALTVHRCPVAVAWDGHFVTVTGISRDGKKLRYEESRGWETNAKRTRTMSLNELVSQAMFAHTHNGIYYASGGGVELTWLSDIPAAEYGKAQPAPDEKNKDYLKLGADGKLSVDVPNDVPGVSSAGRPAEGQINGKGIENILVLDQTKIAARHRVPKINSFGPGGGIMLATSATYYPDRLVRQNDPAILKEVLKENKDTFRELRRLCRDIIEGNADPEDLAAAHKAIAALDRLDDLAKGKKKEAPEEEKDLSEEEKEIRRIENGDLNTVREQLRKLYDHLYSKSGETGKTNFEELFSFKNETAGKKIVNCLKNANEVLELGKGSEAEAVDAINKRVQAEYKKEQAIATRRAKADLAYRHRLQDCWEVVKANAKDPAKRGEMIGALALITADCTLHQQMLDKHIDPPFPDEKDVNALAPKVVSQKAFVTVTSGDMPWALDPNGTVESFIRELNWEEQRIREKEAAAESYAIPEKRLPRIQKRAKKIADALDETKTGSYTGLDIISRLENSDAFEKAKAAIRAFSSAESLTAGQIKTACDTVLKYLEGKEKRRNREFGRDRWNACMSFLANTMPPDKFEDYCRRVNEIRGVGPGSSKYVGPENFYVKGTKLESIMNDSKFRISQGTATLRDYARILAVRNMGDDDELYVGDEVFDTEASMQMLRRKTDKVLSDPRFKGFVEKASKQEMAEMLKNDAEDFEDAWEDHKEEHPLKKDGKAKGSQDRQMMPG